jgi:hypothetical protein
MKVKRKSNPLSRERIDNFVVAQADDDTAWGRPILVRKGKSTSIPLPSEIAACAAFFARLHRERDVEAWVKRIIQERLDLEEAAFAGLKGELAARSEG